ncbi:MAG: hypothetical protein EA400_07785 [Chromatiaceae bacterium]|nr:MAG: hypothetical protein EA400_07785 [Chromatiaceae bacterium]
MHKRRLLLSLLTLLVTLTLVLVGTGCSRMRIAYQTADFFVDRHVNDYLQLDRSQRQQWAPLRKTALAAHREEELPYLAAFFDSARDGAVNGFTRAGMTCLLDQFETIYQRHMRLIIGALAPVLAGLERDQIDALAARFEQEAQKDAANTGPAAAARRARKRAERYESNMGWWIGDLTSNQLDILGDLTAAMPDTAPAWNAYRDRKRQELTALLRQQASAAALERFLRGWLIDLDDLPPDLAGIDAIMREHMTELFLRLGPSFSPAQRARFVDRLTTLRDDFLALQTQPRMAARGC